MTVGIKAYQLQSFFETNKLVVHKYKVVTKVFKSLKKIQTPSSFASKFKPIFRYR